MSTDILTARRDGLDRWKTDALGTIVSFAADLGFDPPTVLLGNPDEALPRLESMLRDEDLDQLEEDGARYLRSNLIVYIGELFSHRHGGRWIVDDQPGPSFAHYVIEAGERRYDPVPIIQALFTEPPPHSLERLIAEAEA